MQALSGRAIIDAIKASGIRIIVSVPDITTSAGLLWPIANDPEFRHIRVCKEDEGVSICAALSYCDQRAMLVMQNTGLYDSANAIRAIAVEYGHPICMMIGLQGAEPDILPDQSPKYSVRIACPMLDVLGVAAGKAKAKVGPEFISVSDFHGLVTMLEGTARRLDDATIGSTEALMEKLWNERGFVVGGPGGPR